MKKILLVSVFVVLLLLVWAALDDITTGKEPSLIREYIIVIASVPILLAIGYFLSRMRNNKKD